MHDLQPMDSTSDENVNPRYLSCVGDEPKQILQPISGYTREPLLSLEEACEPLLNIVPRLPAHIWVAKQNSKNPADGLTQDESAAIRLYTMEWDGTAEEARASLYAHLNRTLKLIDRTKLRPWFRYLKLFVTALAKLPVAPRQTIWRGVRKNYSDEYPPGGEITWWSFSSCTASLNVLESELYLGNNGTRTLFSIEAINARTIRSHSHFTTEDEILLLPGTYFEVKSRLSPGSDLYLVHLQQKIPPHDLLEPPFEGADLFPSAKNPSDFLSSKSITGEKVPERPWYKRKRVLAGIGLATLLIIFIILLTTVLVTRKPGKLIGFMNTSSLPQYNSNVSIYLPVSMGYAFYPFDYDVLDLYGLHDGQLNQNIINYTTGYVGTGAAIVFDQSIPTWISVANPLNIDNSSFTIEAFVFLFNNFINESLVQFSSNTFVKIQMGYLKLTLNGIYNISSTTSLSTNAWHHIAVVYNSMRQSINVYIDGRINGQIIYSTAINSENNNVTMIIGDGFEGIIDQLSISLEAKTDARILWDATVVAYYPFDGDNNGWLLDYGPNCINGSSSGVQSIPGVLHEALSFESIDNYYRAYGFTALSIVNQTFSIALWVRLQNQSGVFLSITNSVTCLLVVGFRDIDNRLVAYLPNSTNTNTGVSVLGSSIENDQWVHIAFTWSSQNQAQLYQSAVPQGKNTNPTMLRNDYAEPMTVSLGMYRGLADCSSVDGIDMNKEFVGSIDELYIFSRELQENEIEQLNTTDYS